MGITSECIEEGLRDGRAGKPTPVFLYGEYAAPYLDGYRMGFIERKVKERYPFSRGFGPGENASLWMDVLEALMTRSRVTRNRHPLRWTHYFTDGSYEYMEPDFERTRIMNANGHISYGPYMTWCAGERRMS